MTSAFAHLGTIRTAEAGPRAPRAQKYQQQFVVVGVHTPEFAFERNIDNVVVRCGR